MPNDPAAVSWTGEFLRDGEPTVPSSDPLIKYEQVVGQTEEAGPLGYGTFWFYANIIPETGTYPNALVGKAGSDTIVWGTLTGAYPSCTITPEPATLALLGLGGLVAVRRRR